MQLFTSGKTGLLQKVFGSGSQPIKDEKFLKMVESIFNEEVNSGKKKVVDVKEQKLVNDLKGQITVLFRSRQEQSTELHKSVLAGALLFNDQLKELTFEEQGDNVEMLCGDKKIVLSQSNLDSLSRKLGLNVFEQAPPPISSSSSELSRQDMTSSFDTFRLHEALSKLKLIQEQAGRPDDSPTPTEPKVPVEQERQERLAKLYSDMERKLTPKGTPGSRSLNHSHAGTGTGIHTPVNALSGTQSPGHKRQMDELGKAREMRNEMDRRFQLEQEMEKAIQARKTTNDQNVVTEPMAKGVLDF